MKYLFLLMFISLSLSVISSIIGTLLLYISHLKSRTIELYKIVFDDLKRIEENPNLMPFIEKRLEDNFEIANKFYEKHNFFHDKESKNLLNKIQILTKDLLIKFKLKTTVE